MTSKPRPRPIKRAPALAIPETSVADAAAIKALNRGDASPEQQKRALDWIMKKAGLIGDAAFDPDNQRVTDFILGRRFVALQILYVLNEPTTTFETTKEKK